MADLPIMPVMTDALLADAGDLPNELFGAYCRLLFRWWRQGAQPEPSAKRLARWAGVSVEEFSDLTEFLTETPDGWIQKKLLETHAKQTERSAKAKASAEKRWSQSRRKANARPPQSARNANAYADAMLSINHEPREEDTDVSPSFASADAKAPEPVEPKPSSATHGVTSLLAEPIPRFETFWQAYPRRITEGGKAVRGPKDEAERKWNQLSPGCKRAAIEALPAFAAAAGDKPPDAVRYLRHRRWRDDIEDAPPQQRPATERLAPAIESKLAAIRRRREGGHQDPERPEAEIVQIGVRR